MSIKKKTTTIQCSLHCLMESNVCFSFSIDSYDVTEGEKYYGEDGSYSMFAGHDVTRGLCLGCKSEECLVRSTEGLTEKELDEGKRWLSFFQLHDKYHFVGNLEGDDSEAWLDSLVESTINEKEDFNPEEEVEETGTEADNLDSTKSYTPSIA